jgi:multicomponent Na+:H+ antiporter subunit G
VSAADWVTVALLLAGGVFFLAGTAGVLRFPDAHARLHALTKADNLGLGLVAAGLAVQAESPAAALRIVLVWVLALVASAASSYLIARVRAPGGRRRWLSRGWTAFSRVALVAVAWRAVSARELFAGVVLYIAFGLLLALTWVRLDAPDIALAEAAVGAGITGALLLDAAAEIRRRRPPAAADDGDGADG